MRKSPSPKDGQYARQDGDDRFVDYAGTVQSIVTSTAVNDSGMFETNLRDDRFLPFEGAGAESSWKLGTADPGQYPAFDYATISDVILHIRYTARQGVETAMVKAMLDDLFQSIDKSSLALVFSLSHDFPNEWHNFANGTEPFSMKIDRNYFPYFAQGKSITIAGMEVYGENVTRHHQHTHWILTPR